MRRLLCRLLPLRLPLALPLGLTAVAPAQAARDQQGCDQQGCLNLVFDGDSISAGTGAEHGQGLDAQVVVRLPGPVASHNTAVGGRPVSDCLAFYSRLITPLYRPDPRNVIAFHAGDNDIALGHGAARAYADFTAYVAQAHAQGWRVVVTTELRRYDFPPDKAAAVERYNDLLRQNDAGVDAVVDLDAEPRLLQPADRHDPAYFTADGVHPIGGGYRLIAGMLAPAIERIVRQ